MSTVYSSIYLYLQFLSSVFYIERPSTGLLPPWLNLFLDTLFFVVVVVAIVNGIIFLISLYDTSLLVYKNATNN